ncbi:MAG: ATP-grasp domain-containing protein [bacterium]|nr:ATP-grasp domain-containing protein [bacterium]
MKKSIAHVNYLSPERYESLVNYPKLKHFGHIVIRDSRLRKPHHTPNKNVPLIKCDFSSNQSVAHALRDIKESVVALSATGENNLRYYKQLIPHLPYINTPTESSIEWSTNKVMMRQKLRRYNKRIAPRFRVVTDTSEETIRKIALHVGFPLVIKPAGLAASILVSICFYEEELTKQLNRTIKQIKQIYKKHGIREEPQILVEQFMEGEMFSIDSYVDSFGTTYHCPIVHVKTGRQIGFDDFFGYQRTTPVKLNVLSRDSAKQTTDDAIYALNLRSTTVHTELMRTEDGWKIIELSPRIGGFRHQMYELGFNMNHSANDILIRLNKKPVLPKRRQQYVAVLQLFARREGKILKIEGLQSITKLKSFRTIEKNLFKGDMARFAKHGGKSVLNVILANSERPQLLADIRRLELLLNIKTQ